MDRARTLELGPEPVADELVEALVAHLEVVGLAQPLLRLLVAGEAVGTEALLEGLEDVVGQEALSGRAACRADLEEGAEAALAVAPEIAADGVAMKGEVAGRLGLGSSGAFFEQHEQVEALLAEGVAFAAEAMLEVRQRLGDRG